MMLPQPHLNDHAETLSLTGKQWIYRNIDERQALRYAQSLDLHDVVARLLVARNIPFEQVPGFLAPSLRSQMPDPSLLKDMEKAAARLVQALTENESIAIFGDYDVDGATSSAILYRFLRTYSDKLQIYIPDRHTEGYGPNLEALKKLKASGASLVVFLDCGTTAHEPLNHLAELGLEGIIIDHHQAEAQLPPVAALVNPNRLDESPATRAELGHLAAVGLTFMLLVALNRALRTTPHYREFNLIDLLDIVALGTVCDVVPLTGLNRVFVAQGLKVMSGTLWVGLKQLMRVAGLTHIRSTYDLGFALGPRLNAGGRMGESDLAARLLTTDDEREAFEISTILDQSNRQRQKHEEEILEAARLQVMHDQPLIMAMGQDWHAGVIGIVASRLQNAAYRPACVIAIKDGVGKGSGRSVPGIDLGAHIIAARQAGLLVNGGGHEMAVGFTVEEGKIPAFREFLTDRLHREITADRLTARLTIDAPLSLPQLKFTLADQLARLEPFGQGHSRPLFALEAVRVSSAKVLKDKHISCTLEDETGQKIQAIAFRCHNQPLGQALLNRHQRLSIAGTLQQDSWQGRRQLKFHIEDARLCR